MSEQYGNDIIELIDEDGNTISLEHVDTVELEGETYMAFVDAETDIDEYCELIILKVETEEDGEEALVSIEDEDLEARLFQIFSERIDAED